MSHLQKLVWLVVLALYPALANAVTYINASTTYSWINASTHTKLGPTTGGLYSSTYSFSNTGGTRPCGSNVPSIDDSMSSNIPIGFTFMYGGVNFTSVRIQSNGRLQFNNNITCGYGSPVTQLPYPYFVSATDNLNYTMRIYGGDLDPSLQSEVGASYVTNCINRNSCYVSYATIGTAPYRSFVVTWSNVPEWTSFASATGSYNVQLILQENGEFVYQYGANTPGPGNTVGQVGWQVDPNDYAVPQTGYPANNTAIKFSIPQPVAEYRMEQPNWSGTAGEILDTSGRGNHASRLGAAQTTATGFLCRGASIPSNNNSGTIDAIDTRLSVPTAMGGAGTITFWYKPTNWASNGNQDAQLFDATTASPDWFFLVKRRIDNSNVVLRFVIRDSTGTDRIAETGNLTNAVLSATGWVHIAVSWNFNALAGANQDHMRIYVNGAQTLQTTFTTAGTVSAGIGTLYFGDNRSGAIGNSGTGRSADGTLDEVRLYNYEGGLALVQRDKDQGGASCLAHYAISHAGTARACDVVPITITAHDSSHNPLLMPNNTTTIQLGTSTNKGDWTLISGYGVLNNGTANDGIATYLFNGEYQAILGLAHTTAGNVNINVTDGQIVESEDPLLTLTSCSAVTKFNACHNYASGSCSTATGRLYTRLAGTAFATDVVSLNSSGVLDNTFTGKAVVSLIARSTTGTVDAANCFTPDYTLTLDNAATSFVAGKLTVNGTVAKAYPDARIKVVCDATNCPPSGITACSADNFAIRPGAVTLWPPWATPPSATATPTLVPGVPFLISATTATAATDAYTGTLNPDTSKLTAQDTTQDTVVQSGGTVGTFLVTSPLIANESPSTGRATYTEVGYLYFAPGAFRDDTFTAVDQPSGCAATNSCDCVTSTTSDANLADTLSGGKYGCSIGNTTSASMGRFRTHHFDTEVTDASGGFTYSGQPFALKVTAKNLAGGTTANYTGVFAKTVTLSDANGAAGVFNPTTLPALNFVNGVADLTAAPSVAFTYTSKLTAPSTLKVRVTNAEGSSSSGTEGTTEIRSGRVRMSNAYGSERLVLPVMVRAEYYTAAGWILNAADTGASATALVAAPTVTATGGITTAANCPPPTACGTSSRFSGGLLDLRMTAPNAAGYADVTLDVPAWLEYPWRSATAEDPRSRVTFGIYKGNNRIIYRRERY